MSKGKPQSMVDAIEAGHITPQQAHTLLKERNLSPLQRQFNDLTADEAFKVFNVATGEEKKTLLPMLKRKVEAHIKQNPKHAAEIKEKLKAAK